MLQNEKKTVNRKPKIPVNTEKNYHHGDLKNALLDSAIKLLRKHGPQAFSLRQLALGLGVSSAAPYRHFKTKEQIFSALAVRGFVLLTEGFQNAIEDDTKNTLEQLYAVGVSYYKFAIRYPEHLQMMFGNIISQSDIAKDKEFGMAASKAFSVLVKVITNCQAVGSLNPKENPKMLAILFWSSVHGFAALDSSGTLQGASGLNYDPQQLVVRISKVVSCGLSIKNKDFYK